MDLFMDHYTVKHKEWYVDGWKHTNTIEGFWSLLKRAWHGTHHHWSLKFANLYIQETCWKWNHRGTADGFDWLVEDLFGTC